jgi:glutaredoxin
VHFSDKASPQVPSEKIHLKINTYTNVTYQSVNRAITADKSAASNAVVLYGTKWCGYCKKARSYFNLRNIRYTDYDVENDANALAKFKSFGGNGVPVIFVGNTRINGFDEGTFDRFYNKK